MTESYARYHARFTLDDVYLQLPEGIRNDAYLYLLALSGHQRAEQAGGDVPIEAAKQLARMMNVNAERALRSLEAIQRDGQPRVLIRTATHVQLLKQSKWQDMPDEIAELKAKRSEAGRRGAESGWERRRQETDQQVPQQIISKPPASAGASAGRLSQQSPAEGEREGEREITKAPPTPSPRRSDAMKNSHEGHDESVLELAKGLHDLVFQRPLSQTEILECQAALNQFAYLTAKDLIDRAQAHQEWCRDNGHPEAKTVGGFGESWRRENDWRADQGHAKATRVAAGRQAGLTAMADLLVPPAEPIKSKPPREATA